MTGATSTPWTAGGPLSRRAGLAVALACLALGGISGLEMRHVSVSHGDPVAWPAVLIITMPRWVLLAATLPIVLAVGVSPSPPRLRTHTVVAHVLLFLAISGPHAVVTAWTTGFTMPMAHFFPWSARIIRAWYNAMPTMASLYAAVLIAAWGMAEARERERRTLRAAQLETQLQAAHLEALRAKLQPHFLYNTLNGIAALVAGAHPARAVVAIEHLSELLHASLRDDARAEITVTEEVALAERYLALQRMRFGERLQYDLDVAPDVADCLVPVLLLQPLVENAVVHGLDAGMDRLHVAIAAASVPEGIELRVDNDGTWLDVGARPARPSAGSGVGLAATRARLATAYGDRASLELSPRDGSGVTVRITLPRSAPAGGPNGSAAAELVETL
jgi:two-component system, LytTR family, sensor kinase